MKNRFHLLLIEDDPAHVTLVRRHLASVRTARFDVLAVDRMGEALAQLQQKHFDAVLSDVRLPDADLHEALPRLVATAASTPVIVLTSLDDQDLAAETVHEGAQDYLAKAQLSGDLLVRSIRYAIERKRGEAQLRRSEDRLRAAMAASQTGTFRWAPLTDELEWDEPMRALYGWDAQSPVTLDAALERIHPEDVAGVRRALAGVKKADDVIELEFRIRRCDGAMRWITCKGRAFNGGSQPLNLIGACSDITERKQAIDQLRELNDNLEARIYERTRSLVHYQERLRALTSELTLTEQRERRRLATELHDYLAQLLVVTRMKLGRLARHDGRDESMLGDIDALIKDCIDYTRTLIAELSPTVLYESGLAAAVAWLGRQMDRHGLSVELEHDENLAPLPEGRLVLVFHSIRELLFNIIKHAGVPKAKVTLRQVGDELHVSVEDEGAGFDPCARESDASGKTKFGLFSIRERIESLGGAFRIESEAGRGTRAMFSVSSEAAEAPARPAASKRSEVGAARPRRGARGITVLLADDHELVREGLRSVIESSEDLEVVGEAGNGEQAIQLNRSLHPDAVVMDVNMPVLNGIEATRRIKAEYPGVTIIGLSVHDDPQVASAMKQAGATAFFTKGESSMELCEAIRSACSDGVGSAT